MMCGWLATTWLIEESKKTTYSGSPPTVRSLWITTGRDSAGALVNHMHGAVLEGGCSESDIGTLLSV